MRVFLLSHWRESNNRSSLRFLSCWLLEPVMRALLQTPDDNPGQPKYNKCQEIQFIPYPVLVMTWIHLYLFRWVLEIVKFSQSITHIWWPKIINGITPLLGNLAKLSFSKRFELTIFLLGSKYIQSYLSIKIFMVTTAQKKLKESKCPQIKQQLLNYDNNTYASI